MRIRLPHSAIVGVIVLLSGGAAAAQDYTSSGCCDPWCFEGPRSGGLD